MIHRLPIPLPLRLAEINAYLIVGRDGWALVDTGMATPAARQALIDGLARFDLEPSGLRQLFVTHLHGDHWGLASWLQSLGAHVIMPRVDAELLARWFGSASYDSDALARHERLGAPEAALHRAAKALAQMRAVSSEFVADEVVEHGQELVLAGERFEVLITPGHTPGHACLHHRESRALLVGDHVLPHITPNITADLGTLDDPLTAYRESLRALRGRGFAVAHPAHGDPMPDLDRRIDEILAHHEEREQRVLELLGDEARSCYAVAEGLFTLSTLDGWETWMAIGETLAHLAAMRTERRVAIEERDGVELFRRA
jgi:glyoxylase-like metal-dependent hydrolase (beta-lactamase superfamily II)